MSKRKKPDFVQPAVDQFGESMKVIIGDHIRWEFEKSSYQAYAEYYTLLAGLSGALLMGDDKVSSAEINRLCDGFKTKSIADELRAQYLEKAANLKPVDWPSYLTKLGK